MPHPMGWSPRALVKQIVPLEEEATHAIHGIAGPGSGASARTPSMAGNAASRHRPGGRPAARPAGEAPLEHSQKPGTSASEPVAPDPAALHLGDRANGTSETKDRSPDAGPASRMGDSAPENGGRAGGRTVAGAAGPAVPWSAATDSAVPSPSTLGLDPTPAAIETAPTGPASKSPARGSGAPGGESAPRPLNGYLRQGAGLYRQFNQFSPAHMVRVTHCRVMPPVVVQLGDLVGLIYRSDKRQRGKSRTYIHRLTTPPRLVSNVDGTQLFLVGGSYRITPRGVEG